MNKMKKNISIEEELIAKLFEHQLITEENEKDSPDEKENTDKNKEKDDTKTSEEDEISSKDLETIGISKEDIDKNTADLDKKKHGMFVRSLIFLGKMINSAADSLLASNLDDFTLGNFRETLCDIYKEKKLSKMSDDDLQKEADALHSSPGFDKADKKSKLDSRKDDNENSEIDESSCQYKCQFWAEKDEENLLKQLENLTTDILKQAKQLEDSKKKVVDEIKNKKIEGVGDGEIDAFGPMIKNMLDDGKSPEEISKKVSEMKTGVKESYDKKVLKYTKRRILTEGKVLITEQQKNIFLMEALIESDEYIDNMTRYLISEGFFDGIKKMAKATGDLAKKAVKSGSELAKAAWNKVPEKYRNMIKDMSEKALNALKDGALGPILSIAGIGLMIATGSWGIALILACMTLILKHGKYLKAAFDKHWDAFKNSKGTIALMDFNIKDNKDLKYSMRYYIIDQTWRVLNLRNQSLTPSLDFSKAIIKSNIGLKFTKELQKKWDPVFNKDKGGKINFKELLSQSKDLKLTDEQLKLLEDFKTLYDKTLAAMNKPQIDTRAVSAKDAVAGDVKKVKDTVDKVKDSIKK